MKLSSQSCPQKYTFRGFNAKLSVDAFKSTRLHNSCMDENQKEPLTVESGKRLAKARLQAGLKQGELADIAREDYKGRIITAQRISNYEAGSRSMDFQIIRQLAEILNVDPAWIACFVSDDEAMKPDEKALLDNYRSTDDRGKRTISRIAEQERPYQNEGLEQSS